MSAFSFNSIVFMWPGALLETTHAYRTILKGGFLLCQFGMLFFFSMLFSNNFLGLLGAFALLGLFMLPMLPAVIENCAECTYPIPEELSTGILFVGGNIMGIPFIFIVQVRDVPTVCELRTRHVCTCALIL
jgi:hypothetical protein